MGHMKNNQESLKYKGSCSCNEVQFETLGEPLFTQICHCNKCRKIASQSERQEDKKGFSHTAAYFYKSFKIIKGEDQLEAVEAGNAFLYLCNKCRSLIYGISKDLNNQEGIGMNVNNFDFTDNKLPSNFEPVRHVYYENHVIGVEDSLPKFVDFPTELGGSGKKIE